MRSSVTWFSGTHIGDSRAKVPPAAQLTSRHVRSAVRSVLFIVLCSGHSIDFSTRQSRLVIDETTASAITGVPDAAICYRLTTSNDGGERHEQPVAASQRRCIAAAEPCVGRVTQSA